VLAAVICGSTLTSAPKISDTVDMVGVLFVSFTAD
jgi:hypothetical protein